MKQLRLFMLLFAAAAILGANAPQQAPAVDRPVEPNFVLRPMMAQRCRLFLPTLPSPARKVPRRSVMASAQQVEYLSWRRMGRPAGPRAADVLST